MSGIAKGIYQEGFENGRDAVLKNLQEWFNDLTTNNEDIDISDPGYQMVSDLIDQIEQFIKENRELKGDES